MGVERIAMMKYGISEIGQFFAGTCGFCLSSFRDKGSGLACAGAHDSESAISES